MKRKYPFVKQKDEKDCGVACLSMLLKYYGGNMPYDMLYDKLDCNQLGTSAYKLVTVAKEIGFSAIGLSCRVEDIKTDSLPCIAHVLLDNKYYHYIVIYEINFKKNKIIMADPSCSLKIISLDEFKTIFNKVIIELFPIKSLPLYNNTNTPINYLFHIIKKYRKNIILLIIISIISMTFYMISSLSIYILLNQNIVQLKFTYIIYILVLYLLKNFTSLIQNKKMLNMESIIREKIKMDTFRNIIFLPYKTYCNRTTGEIVSRMVDANNIGEVISSYIVSFSINILSILCSIILLWIIEPKITIIILILCFIYYILCYFLDRKEKSYQETLKRKNGEIHHELIEYIEGFETIKGINKENEIISYFNNHYQHYEDYIKQFNMRLLKRNTICIFLEDILYLSIGLLGIYMIQLKLFTLQKFFLFYSIFGYMIPSLKQLVEIHHSTYETKEIITRMLDFGLYKTQNMKKECKKIKEIELRQVSYETNNFKSSIFNLKIKSGNRIFVYGKSGGGKSTLLKLLKGYYKEYEGDIFVNQKIINDYNKDSVKKRIVYVSQQETLFTDTIQNNICMHRNVNMKDLKIVLEITKSLEVLKNRSIGLKTLIEENGCNFSGGERQRIILARTLLEDADVFLFDESFSEMDSNMERIILKNIMNLYPDKIIIVVSHRFDNQDLFNIHIHIDRNMSCCTCYQERSLLCLNG